MKYMIIAAIVLMPVSAFAQSIYNPYPVNIYNPSAPAPTAPGPNPNPPVDVFK